MDVRSEGEESKSLKMSEEDLSVFLPLFGSSLCVETYSLSAGNVTFLCATVYTLLGGFSHKKETRANNSRFFLPLLTIPLPPSFADLMSSQMSCRCWRLRDPRARRSKR